MSENWQEDFAKDRLAAAGFTDNFRDLSYHDYQGTIRYAAQDPASKEWAEVSYSYGSCSHCDPTYDWQDEDYREALSDIHVCGTDTPQPSEY